MEKIITHYAGSVPLDTESLKVMAEAIDNKNVDATQVQRQAPIMDSPGSEFLGADDENYTVQPLDNNTTRKTCLLKLKRKSKCLTSPHRLLRRILSLELLNANQAVDRAVCARTSRMYHSVLLRRSRLIFP
jgi:hypothetical protein